MKLKLRIETIIERIIILCLFIKTITKLKKNERTGVSELSYMHGKFFFLLKRGPICKSCPGPTKS